jgi:two-component system KDP operon response regulator KdpE
LLRAIWGPTYINQSQITGVYCTYKKKIEENPNRPEYLLTEAGVGYRFISNQSE